MSRPTLNLSQLQDINRTVRTRDGWEMDVYETAHQGIWWRLTAEVDDSYNPGQKTTLRVKSPLPPMHSMSEFLEWVLWRLERIYIHECHEELRWVDSGKPIFDPHGEDADEPVEF